MNDLSLLTSGRKERRFFLEPEIQASAERNFPDASERQRVIRALSAHPKPDVLLAPHAGFSCETCHLAEDRSNDPALSPERKKYWRERYIVPHPGLESVLLRRWDFLHAVCLKCHPADSNLAGAELLSRSRTVFEAAACHLCHTTPGMKFRDADLNPGEVRVRKPGPPLTSLASKVDKLWAYNWIRHPPSFKPTARMPAIFSREPVGWPATALPAGLDLETARACEEVMIACVTELLFATSAPAGLKEIPPGLFETEEWKIEDQRERGRRIVVERGCLGCHLIDENYAPDFRQRTIFLEEEFATNLFGSGDKFDSALGRRWLFNWLKDPSRYSPDTAMPRFDLTDSEIADVVEFLVSLKVDNEARIARGISPWRPRSPPALRGPAVELLLKHQSGPVEGSDREKVEWIGRKVIEEFTCYSCHLMGPEWDERPAVWGNLSKDLLPPREIMSRMPLYELYGHENDLIGLYLLGAIEATEATAHQPDARRKKLTQGERLIRKYNCEGCHTLAEAKFFVRDGNALHGLEASIKKLPGDEGRWSVEWLVDPATLALRPVQRKYDRGLPTSVVERVDSRRAGAFEPRRLAGLEEEEFESARRRLPPSLRTVGRKLNPSWMAQYLRRPFRLRAGQGPVMPTFNFQEGEVEALVEYFRVRDGSLAATGRAAPSDDRLLEAERTIQTACSVCHPVDGEGGEMSVDLASIHPRLEREWLVAFLRDPASIYPATTMPRPPAGVDPEDLADALLQFDRLREVKIARGDARQVLEALRAHRPELARMAIRRIAREPGLAEAAPRAVSQFLRDPGPAEEMESLLEHPSPSVRALAVDALVRLGSRDSIGEISALLSDEDDRVVRACLAALRRFGGPEHRRLVSPVLTRGQVSTRLEAVETLAAWGCVEEVAAALEDSNGSVRETAVRKLAELGAPSAPIARRLKDREVEVRVRAADALGVLIARDRRAAVIEALKDDHPDVRCAALLALARWGEGPAEAAALMADSTRAVRAAAAACLAASGDARGAGALLEMLKEGSGEGWTRRAFGEGIAGLVTCKAAEIARSIWRPF
jgi:HEAT repeat protein/mono/diheme cytochrome c family protein